MLGILYMVIYVDTYNLALNLFKLCLNKKIKIVTAESCTGGMLASVITDIPQISKVFDRGFITYSNQSKIELLNVSNELLKANGAVSSEVAVQMARGALMNSEANIAISITGIAGPGGATKDKPIGLVYFGIASSTESKDNVVSRKKMFPGGRKEIRSKATSYALSILIEFIQNVAY